MLPIISSQELRKINEAILNNEKEISVSLDLGSTKQKIKLFENGFVLNGERIKKINIRQDDKSCYVIFKGELHKVQFFSHTTKDLYKLVPTGYRPILKISGTSMHKKPFLDRIEKDKLRGQILDSGTGLGYSAIIAAKTAEKVITIEIDENVIEIAKLNPYSQELFKNKKIQLIIGNISDKISEFKNDSFNFIILDAGTPKSSADFFSQKNYNHAYRILKEGGKLYHYLPKHHIMRGRDFSAEVIKRIKKAKFRNIERNIADSYIVAEK